MRFGEKKAVEAVNIAAGENKKEFLNACIELSKLTLDKCSKEELSGALTKLIEAVKNDGKSDLKATQEGIAKVASSVSEGTIVSGLRMLSADQQSFKADQMTQSNQKTYSDQELFGTKLSNLNTIDARYAFLKSLKLVLAENPGKMDLQERAIEDIDAEIKMYETAATGFITQGTVGFKALLDQAQTARKNHFSENKELYDFYSKAAVRLFADSLYGDVHSLKGDIENLVKPADVDGDVQAAADEDKSGLLSHANTILSNAAAKMKIINMVQPGLYLRVTTGHSGVFTFDVKEDGAVEPKIYTKDCSKAISSILESYHSSYPEGKLELAEVKPKSGLLASFSSGN
ncbi:hypothetical protein OAT84_03445 [Gammaproteobacteria bacterium]|nr:hypothetical protein [Gammaproteobacteria bacterium]